MKSESAPLAYALADHITLLMASEHFAQRTAGMEYTEFIETLAGELGTVLDGQPAPLPKPHPSRLRWRGAMTDAAARALLVNHPDALAVYDRNRRRMGVRPSLDAAVKSIGAGAEHD